MGRFDTQHDWVKRFEPFASAVGDQERIIDALLAGLRQDNLTNSKLWDALGLTSAEGDNLDLFGEVLGLPRDSGESDTDYRSRLLTARQARQRIGTPQAIHEAVYGVIGNYDHGVVYLKDRILWDAPEALLPTQGPISELGLFSYIVYLLDVTDEQLGNLIDELRLIAPLRDRILLAQVDDDITPATIAGTATASTEIEDYEASKAIDGTLGGDSGLNAFYWNTAELPPNPDSPPWWKAELSEPKLISLLMINQQTRADVMRLQDVRITITPPDDCQLPGLTYTQRLPDVGDADYNRWYFPLPRPVWASEIKIEPLSAYDDGRTYLSLGEVEVYSPDEWTTTRLKELYG